MLFISSNICPRAAKSWRKKFTSGTRVEWRLNHCKNERKPKLLSSINVLYESTPPSLSKVSSSLNGSHVIFPSQRIWSLEILSKCWTFFLTYSTSWANCSASVRSLLWNRFLQDKEITTTTIVRLQNSRFRKAGSAVSVILECEALAVFSLAQDLSFEYGPSLAFAKNTAVLQSKLL